MFLYPRRVIWHACCTFLNDFGVTSEASKSSVWWEKYCKKQFSQMIFLCFLMALGTILMTFGALEAGLEFDDFSWLPRGGSELR